jgi:predicted metalloendopeptidase
VKTRRQSKKKLSLITPAVTDTPTITSEISAIDNTVQNQNEILNAWCPLVWRMDPDQKNATIYQNTITMPILSIYDYMTYIVDMNKENDRQHNYRLMLKRKFIKYVDEIFDSCLGKGKHGLHGKDVYDVEYQLLVAMGCQGIKENADYYNKVKADEALPKYGFDWPAFSRHLGYKQVPPFFICNNLNYLRCINKLLQDNWKTPQWKSFWYYTALKQMIRFDKKRRNIHFEYHEKLLHGQPSPFPQEIYPIFGLSFTFNTLLTKLYYDANYNQSKIHFVKSFYTDLLAVYKRIVKRNSWMSSKTKNYAIHKLNHLKLIVGKPDVLREDPLLDYEADDAWGNMRKLADWKLRKSLLLMNNPVVDIPYFDWNIFKLIGKQSYIVNAFYTPTENSIYIPLAILQDPFINFTGRGVEYNLSHIGITLSHEMSHSLDKWGSKYNAHGNLHNWWTKEDTRKYNLIIKDIIQQYEEFARYDGIEFDASIGIGEDMADISGLAIAEEYLRDYHMINNSVVPVVSLSFQKFFIFYAVQNRQHIYKQAFDAQLKTNPHPMDKYRTNVPLSRLELFRSLYNIKKGDKMWWHSTSTIW